MERAFSHWASSTAAMITAAPNHWMMRMWSPRKITDHTIASTTSTGMIIDTTAADTSRIAWNINRVDSTVGTRANISVSSAMRVVLGMVSPPARANGSMVTAAPSMVHAALVRLSTRASTLPLAIM